jgi:hypothetical protein
MRENTQYALRMIRMPAPWRKVGRSPNRITAPAKVKSGALARMGEASEMGRCLSAK